jgi:hypothetical protein
VHIPHSSPAQGTARSPDTSRFRSWLALVRNDQAAPGNDHVDGGPGLGDEVIYLDASGWPGSRTPSGRSSADVITGDDGPNRVQVFDGNDELFGLGGHDVLIGDFFGFTNAGNDSADGGPGTDECDAETEVSCEAGPPPRVAAAVFERMGWSERLQLEPGSLNTVLHSIA